MNTQPCTTADRTIHQPEAKQAQVSNIIDHLGKALEMLTTDIDKLQNELAPVSQQQVPATPQPEQQHEAHCPVAERLYNLLILVMSLQMNVQSMRRDLAI